VPVRRWQVRGVARGFAFVATRSCQNRPPPARSTGRATGGNRSRCSCGLRGPAASHFPVHLSCSSRKRTSVASHRPYPAIRKTIFPRECPLSPCSNAWRACSSGSTVSTKARKWPESIRRPISSSCVRLGSTMKNSPLIPRAFAFSAEGGSTILTSVPPWRRTP
jgi:hypothetical protein